MKNKILFVCCVITGLLFLNGGLNKIFNYMPVPTDLPADTMQMFIAMSQIVWLMPLLAVVEIVGAVLLMIPRFRALGAVILLPVTVGIVLSHITVAPEGLPMAIVLFGVLIWVIIENRRKYLPMVTA